MGGVEQLALVLDQGGHSTRVVVFDASGAVVAQAAIAINTLILQSGWIEQDPSELVASLRFVLDAIAEQLGEQRCQHITSAALVVQRSSLLAWDRLSRQALSSVLSWQDTRNSAWLEKTLTENHGSIRNVIRDKTGLYPNAHYGASKMHWLLDNVPAMKDAASHHTLCIAPLASFLQQQLTAQLTTSTEPVVDAVIASRTMLTETAALHWSPALLDIFDIPLAVLPVIKPTLADYGAIRIANRQLPLRLLGGDQSFFALSHGILFDEKTVFINAGTGAFIQQKMLPLSVPHKLLCAALCIGDSEENTVFVAEGTVNAAATALDWLWQRVGCTFSGEDWVLAARQTESDSTDVPYFINRITASGSPDWLPAGESFFSMDASVQLQAIAVLESIVFALQRNLDCLATVQPCEKIIVSGGLSKLDIFCQSLADLTNKPVWRSDDVEACARGAAMQLLPEAALQQAYYEYAPQNRIELQQRYERWTVVMNQLSVGG